MENVAKRYDMIYTYKQLDFLVKSKMPYNYIYTSVKTSINSYIDVGQRSSSTNATPEGDPRARWKAPGSDPGIGRLSWLPEESQ